MNDFSGPDATGGQPGSAVVKVHTSFCERC